MRRTNALALSALSVLSLVAGCGAAPVESHDSALVNTRWRLGTADYISGWSSGNTTSLSAWKTVNCASAYGTQFLLTALTGYKEPAGNLDNFIARLEATCTEFAQTSETSATVFTTSHRSTAYTLDAFDWQGHSDLLCPAYYYAGPMGQTGVIGAMEIGLNPGNDYVQNFRFFPRCARLNADDTISWSTPIYGVTNQMIDDAFAYDMFNRAKVSCPGDNYVATGIQLRYDTRNGKIRDLRLVCRSLTWN